MAMLEVNHLTTEFTTENGIVRAVRDVSLHVEKGEVLGIVGESGSGKSQTMFSVMGLLAQNGTITSGSIKIDGEEISPAIIKDRKEYENKMDRIRGNDMAMIFQDPMTFLNPVLRIQTQLIEPIINHNPGISKKEAIERAIELMRKVVKDGDIIALTTSLKGLDIQHIGFAVWHADGLHLLNASSLRHKVVEEPMTLYRYLQRQRTMTGMRIVRLSGM